MKNKLKWVTVKKIMDIIQFVIVVGGVGFAVHQVSDLTHQKLGRENELSLMYYDRLSTGKNEEIRLAVLNEENIFQRFSLDQINNYLNFLSDVGDRLEKGLLDEKIICNDFYDITESTYSDPMIREYIIDIQKDDQSYFAGINYLHKFMQNDCE